MQLLPIDHPGYTFLWRGTRRFGIFCTSFFILLCSHHILRAANGDDSLRRGMSILAVAIINYDCHPDTVWGTREGDLNAPFYLPRIIFWGKPSPGKKAETKKCTGHIPEKKRLRFTTILYPTWKNLTGSISIHSFNPEDTLRDLLFALRGTVNDDSTPSARILLIFGQHGLDTIATIDLGKLPAFQSHPFTAMELRGGTEVVNEKRRQNARRRSYELLPVGFLSDERDDEDTVRNAPGLVADVKVYPNPTGIAATVEGVSIPPGEYGVEIVSVNGEIIMRRDVTVPASGSLLGTLDLRDIPSGYYVIRLSAGQLPVGTYPIVVTR